MSSAMLEEVSSSTSTTIPYQDLTANVTTTQAIGSAPTSTSQSSTTPAAAATALSSSFPSSSSSSSSSSAMSVSKAESQLSSAPFDVDDDLSGEAEADADDEQEAEGGDVQSGRESGSIVKKLLEQSDSDSDADDGDGHVNFKRRKVEVLRVNERQKHSAQRRNAEQNMQEEPQAHKVRVTLNSHSSQSNVGRTSLSSASSTRSNRERNEHNHTHDHSKSFQRQSHHSPNHSQHQRQHSHQQSQRREFQPDSSQSHSSDLQQFRGGRHPHQKYLQQQYQPQQQHYASREQSLSRGNPTMSLSSTTFPSSRYFVMRSIDRDDVELSITQSLWATQKHNERILNDAFRSSKHVYLLFSVNKSDHFQGYAEMTTAIDYNSNKVWLKADGRSTWGKPFSVRWLQVYSLPFREVQHLKNPLNFDFSIRRSMDGQELTEELGRTLMKRIDEGAERVKREEGEDKAAAKNNFLKLFLQTQREKGDYANAQRTSVSAAESSERSSRSGAPSVVLRVDVPTKRAEFNTSDELCDIAPSNSSPPRGRTAAASPKVYDRGNSVEAVTESESDELSFAPTPAAKPAVLHASIPASSVSAAASARTVNLPSNSMSKPTNTSMTLPSMSSNSSSASSTVYSASAPVPSSTSAFALDASAFSQIQSSFAPLLAASFNANPNLTAAINTLTAQLTSATAPTLAPSPPAQPPLPSVSASPTPSDQLLSPAASNGLLSSLSALSPLLSLLNLHALLPLLTAANSSAANSAPSNPLTQLLSNLNLASLASTISSANAAPAVAASDPLSALSTLLGNAAKAAFSINSNGNAPPSAATTASNTLSALNGHQASDAPFSQSAFSPASLARTHQQQQLQHYVAQPLHSTGKVRYDEQRYPQQQQQPVTYGYVNQKHERYQQKELLGRSADSAGPADHSARSHSRGYDERDGMSHYASVSASTSYRDDGNVAHWQNDANGGSRERDRLRDRDYQHERRTHKKWHSERAWDERDAERSHR